MKKTYVIKDVFGKSILMEGKAASIPSMQFLPPAFWDTSIIKFDSKEEAEFFIENNLSCLNGGAVTIVEVYE